MYNTSYIVGNERFIWIYNADLPIAMPSYSMATLFFFVSKHSTAKKSSIFFLMQLHSRAKTNAQTHTIRRVRRDKCFFLAENNIEPQLVVYTRRVFFLHIDFAEQINLSSTTIQIKYGWTAAVNRNSLNVATDRSHRQT